MNYLILLLGRQGLRSILLNKSSFINLFITLLLNFFLFRVRNPFSLFKLYIKLLSLYVDELLNFKFFSDVINREKVRDLA